MAEVAGSLNCIYASSGGASWQDASYFYAGKSGSWYRTKVVITTGSFTGQSSCLKVSININGQASPVGCMGVLTTNGSLATNRVMNDNMTGPHSDLTSGSIAQSYAYSNRACTTAESGTNKQSGYVVYYKFDSSSLQPNTTYYAYFCYKSGRGSSSGWTQSTESRMSTWVEYTPHYAIDVNMYRADEDKWYYSGDGINKFHADVGGTRRATNASDFGYSAAAGTSYSVTPVAATGYHYNGTQGGSAISGTYPSSNFSVNLNFGKNYAYILYNQNGGMVTNSSYSINQYGWITTGNSYQFDPIYYGDSEDPYNASTFGLIRPGHSFGGWKVQGTNKILNQDTKYPATDYVNCANASQTVANANNFNCYTFAVWNPNNYTITLDPNGGSVSSSSVSLTYGNSAYTGLPTPTNGGKKFGGWFADIGNNGPIQLGLDYRYTDALNVGFDAYKEDWTDWNASEAFISCTNSGGWNLFAHSGLMGSDVWDAGAGAYKNTSNMFDLNTLSPGWHHFDMVFANKKMYYYVDNVEVATSATFSGNIGLNHKSCLWLGAEAGGGEAHDGACVFNGLLKNVRILNSTWADYPASVFPIPAQNITLYADWESSSYMFVKVDGEWKVGKTFIKLGNSWIG